MSPTRIAEENLGAQLGVRFHWQPRKGEVQHVGVESRSLAVVVGERLQVDVAAIQQGETEQRPIGYVDVMGAWFPAPRLLVDEMVSFRCAANLFHGRRQIGGQVIVTNQRVLFVPNRLESLFGARAVKLRLADVSAVRLEPPRTKVARTRGLSALVRPQVEIEYAGGMLVSCE